MLSIFQAWFVCLFPWPWCFLYDLILKLTFTARAFGLAVIGLCSCCFRGDGFSPGAGVLRSAQQAFMGPPCGGVWPRMVSAVWADGHGCLAGVASSACRAQRLCFIWGSACRQCALVMAVLCLEARGFGHAGCCGFMGFDCGHDESFLADSSFGSLVVIALFHVGGLCFTTDLGDLARQSGLALMTSTLKDLV